VASLITLFVSYSWFTYFGVVKWARLVILALGVLACAGSAISFVTTTIASIQAFGSGTTAVTAGEVEMEVPDVPELPTKPGAVPANAKPPRARVDGAKADVAEAAAKAEMAKAGALGGTDFQSWALQRDAVEKAIAADPTVLKRVPGVQESYRKLQLVSYEQQQEYEKAIRATPGEAKLHEHLREAEIFEKTKTLVPELKSKLDAAQ
jgi:hypothetical protein